MKNIQVQLKKAEFVSLAQLGFFPKDFVSVKEKHRNESLRRQQCLRGHAQNTSIWIIKLSTRTHICRLVGEGHFYQLLYLADSRNL